MRFLTAIAALAGAIGTAFAQSSDFHALTRPGMNEEVPAGKTYTVTWNVASKYEDETVVIGLLGGPTGKSLRELGSIGTADGSSGSFSWSVSSSLGEEKTYGLKISLLNDLSIFQYSTPFSISGGVKGASEDTTTTAKSTSEDPSSTTKKETPSTTSESSTTEKKSRSSTSTTEEEKTTSTSSEKEESTTTSTTESSTKESSTTTTFSTVTQFTSSSTDGASATTAEPSASATSEPDDESSGGGTLLGLSTGAWVGIGAGGLVGLLLIVGIAVKAVKMKRSREHERYADIDGQY